MGVVETIEGTEKIYCYCGEVHDEVAYCLGDGLGCWGWEGRGRGGTGFRRFWGKLYDVFARRCEGEEVVGCEGDEFVAVLAEGVDVVDDLGGMVSWWLWKSTA